ncbi:MarR family winged helix-turn-helix transcriptional regulator [Streptacidiphilus cavernicola]|uniref:MarR family winged helix-turn-helix transcriptional regulator n=1 Tax=Streptacidiphilus cavernicola TaxID=3342716 RepID=A0ABV6VZC3_9ACTN
MVNTAGGGPDPTDEEIQAFQRGTRDLIGVALHSLDAAGGEVSLPQLRMLLALGDLGRCPSSRAAKALGLSASSITRLADRLAASGHLLRGSDPHSRSVVTLELSPKGRALVDRVLAWRHDELERLLALIDPVLRQHAAQALAQLHATLGDAYADELPGPVPL